MNDPLYFRQLLSGRDFARTDPIAGQMVNFTYAVGDRTTGEALVVDPAYDVAGIVDALAEDDMTVKGVLLTHYHADHCGGEMMGFRIEGVRAVKPEMDEDAFRKKQADAWNFVRRSIAQGRPCYGWE
ncbi:MAG: MBL fold metallo-hydrolase, partial [Acidimicrobiales bacterium]